METNSRSSRGALALAWWFCVATLVACGGGSGDSPAPGAAPTPGPAPAPGPAPSPGPAPTPPPIAQTQPGDPEGLPTFATIGAAGGTLASSDGRLTIAVPSGALSTDTLIGIEPISAKAPGAFGSDYRLTPEGITFAQPVTLTFTHSAAEAAATVADSLRVATRDARGHWVLAGATRDAAQRTTRVTTTHFSDWSYVAGQRISPPSATVALDKTITLRVRTCGDQAEAGNEQRLLLECFSDITGASPQWSVNGAVNGNAADGTITTIAGIERVARYNAPSALPAPNPVAVEARFDSGTGSTLLVSNVTVVDELPAYEGAAFGRVLTRIGNEEQWVEMSANLRFTRNAQLSIGGDQWYDGTGTAYVRGKPFGCGSGSGNGAVQGASLVLHTEGPLAGTYSLSAAAIANVTLSCGDPPAQVTGPIAGGIGAGGADAIDICPAVPIGPDPGALSGSWSCTVADGSSMRANWTLRAAP